MPDQMLMGNSPIPLRKVKQACLLAKNLGCKRVGLGSFTSVVSKSGTLLTGNPELAGLHFTTGNTTTAYTTLSNISKHSGEAGMHTEETTIALLGATGSIGKAVSIYLAKLPYKECILIGRDNAKLESLKREIDGEAGGRVRKITTTSSLDSIREADVLVVMTSSASFLVDSRLLKSGSLVLDITQPSNISDLVVRERSDVTFIDIGLVQTPGVEIRYNLGIARGTAFACLAETMILASEHSEEDFVGHVDFRHIDRIEKLFGASQFKLTSIVRK
jgi:predicted amino acid dehydrogenase